MTNLTETLHDIPGTRREYVAFSGANAATPYLSDAQQKYQRKLFASVGRCPGAPAIFMTV
nr:citrate lyase subunit alpha [Raoultella sp. NCTC 9187]